MRQENGAGGRTGAAKDAETTVLSPADHSGQSTGKTTLLVKWHWLRQVLAAGASGAVAAVAAELADHHNDEHGCAWPSQARLAERAGQTERNVRGALAWLSAAKFIEIVPGTTARGGRRNAYRCVWAATAQPEETFRSNRKKRSGPTGKDLPVATGRNVPVNPLTYESTYRIRPEDLSHQPTRSVGSNARARARVGPTETVGRRRFKAEIVARISGYVVSAGEPARSAMLGALGASPTATAEQIKDAVDSWLEADDGLRTLLASIAADEAAGVAFKGAMLKVFRDALFPMGAADGVFDHSGASRRLLTSETPPTVTIPSLELLLARGFAIETIAKMMGLHRNTPHLWRTGRRNVSDANRAGLDALAARLLDDRP